VPDNGTRRRTRRPQDEQASGHFGPEIPITVSLGFIAGTLIVTTAASLIQDRSTRRSAEEAERVDSPV
jgi:hypothetical protein